MKNFLIAVMLLLGMACNNTEQKETEIKEALKPLIERQIVAGKLKCELSFVKIHEEELSVFCLPVDRTDEQMVNELRFEITSFVSDWSSSKGYKFKKIRTRFSDELSDTVKK